MDIRKKILNSINEGVFTIDDEWKITSFNRSAELLTGYTKEEALGKYCKEIFKSNKCGENCPMMKSIKIKKTINKTEIEIISKKGKKIPIRVKNYPLKNDSDEIIGGIELFEDISEIIELRNKIEISNNNDLIGSSDEIIKIKKMIRYAADVDSNILVSGETGTGKELVVNSIQKNSKRAKNKFVKINCAAIPASILESELFGYEKGAFTGASKTKKGYFEQADGGTLFLDEIGELEKSLQVKLLRVLQEGEFYRLGGEKIIKIDVRLLAATNRNLLEEVKEGKFREDLFYRLNVFNIKIPPLRERKEDLVNLLGYFLNKYNVKMNKKIISFSEGFLEILKKYDFPGNIRELENIVEHSFIKCINKSLEVKDLPEYLLKNKIDLKVEMNEEEIIPFEEMEKRYILNILEKFDGNKLKTARVLKLDIKKIYRRLKKWGIH